MGKIVTLGKICDLVFFFIIIIANRWQIQKVKQYMKVQSEWGIQSKKCDISMWYN